jgi:hypothetical protein
MRNLYDTDVSEAELSASNESNIARDCVKGEYWNKCKRTVSMDAKPDSFTLAFPRIVSESGESLVSLTSWTPSPQARASS